MIPLRDENPVKTVPYVTLALIGINILVFLYEISLGYRLEEVLYIVGAIPHDILHPPRPATLLTLVTSLFFHAGFLHIVGNMLYLWIFGNNVEESLGHVRFLFFYLFCGVAATFGHCLSAPGAVTPLIGASGAISGVLGAYLLLYPRARVLTLIPFFFFVRIVKIPAVFFLGIWFFFQLLNSAASLLYADSGEAGVAWVAHAVGFLAGMLFLNLLMKRKAL